MIAHNAYNVLGAIPFLRPLVPSLTILGLYGYQFVAHQVCEILGLFTQQHRLRVLDIQLDFMTPQLFDMCSEKLPNLEKLHLFADGYRSCGTEDYISSVEADEEMVCNH
jgi:hypothetical protein